MGPVRRPNTSPPVPSGDIPSASTSGSSSRAREFSVKRTNLSRSHLALSVFCGNIQAYPLPCVNNISSPFQVPVNRSFHFTKALGWHRLGFQYLYIGECSVVSMSFFPLSCVSRKKHRHSFPHTRTESSPCSIKLSIIKTL